MKTSDILRGYVIHIRIYAILKDEYFQLKENGDISCQQYHERIKSGNNIRSPVENYCSRIYELERLMQELMKFIEPVKSLIYELNLNHENKSYKIMLIIIECHYWKNETITAMSKRLGIHRKKIIMHKNKLLRMLESYTVNY